MHSLFELEEKKNVFLCNCEFDRVVNGAIGEATNSLWMAKGNGILLVSFVCVFVEEFCPTVKPRKNDVWRPRQVVFCVCYCPSFTRIEFRATDGNGTHKTKLTITQLYSRPIERHAIAE